MVLDYTGQQRLTAMLQYLKTNLYDPLWKGIIRPPREHYSTADLGPRYFKLQGSSFERKDFRVLNGRGHRLQCSHFTLCGSAGRPVVVMLHGNASSRLACFKHLKQVLPLADVVCFDFAGSGTSEGDWVSLGHFQKQDLRAVLLHIRTERKAGRVVLWGRSMGAVTALLYAPSDRNLAGMILDSPFSDFNELMREVASSYVPVLPEFVANYLVGLLRETVLEKAGFDICGIVPVRQGRRSRTPALFLSGTEDVLINHKHSERLYQQYGGPKQLLLHSGGHNDKRPSHVIGAILFKIEQVLQPIMLRGGNEQNSQIDSAIERITEKQERKEVELLKQIHELGSSALRQITNFE